MDAVPANLLTVWSRLLFASLAGAGVRDIVFSPGSRSTPFLLAAAQDARLRLHEAIDERAAAFFALGQARVTGMPSVLLCTSGSAGANYLPAVIEAGEAGVPLLVLTADRPAELLHVSANQTIDQRMLFEGYARRVVDVGAPDAAPSALRGLRRLAAHAVALTRAPHPGAVHLNLRARKPLEPVAASTPAEQALEEAVSALIATAPPAVAEGVLRASDDEIEHLAEACLGARRGVIVAGPAPASQDTARVSVARFARAAGFAVLAEATSQLRLRGAHDDGVVVIPTAEWLYRLPAGDREWLPDFVIQLGMPPTSIAWERLLERHPAIRRVVLSPVGWPDPRSDALEIVHADLDDTCARLAAALERRLGTALAPSAEFAGVLAAADQRARAVIDRAMPHADAPLSEAAVSRTVASVLPERAWLAVGNSLPVRTLDAYCHDGARDLRVLSQRGGSGIEGLVAGAAGAASVAEAPVALMVGDVSALHDIGGFALCANVTAPLAVIVVNNGGGRIFEQLPVARVVPGEMLERFTTPRSLDFEDAARFYRLPFARVRTGAELGRALAQALAQRGCTIIDAVVPPHGAAADQARILADLA